MISEIRLVEEIQYNPMNKYKFKKIEVKFSQYILLLVFFSLLTVLLIIQFNKLIEEKINELKDKEGQKIALENRISNLDKLEKEYTTISSDVENINNLLPSQDKLIDIINKIEAMANENHVELSTKFEQEPTAHKLPAKFMVKGYTNDVMSFYNKLIADNVLVYIIAANMSDANNMLDNVKAEIQTEVYFD